jgi:hypothetical protein
MKRVAVIGSGFAGYGVILALQGFKDIEIHLIDIGLTDRLAGQPDNAIPNAKKCMGSYFPYGLNDARSPVGLTSVRICSSHAFGGYSTVYSGSICYPKNSDLAEWPSASRPQAIDYQAILDSMPVWHEPDSLDTQFPMPPRDADLDGHPPSHDCHVLGLSRIATREPVSHPATEVEVFSTGDALQKLVRQGRIAYHPDCYVERISISGEEQMVHYQRNGEDRFEAFDAVFVGAGCVNTTGIVDRSLFGEGEREYFLQMTTGTILSFLRASLHPPESTRTRQLNKLPGFFLEIHSSLTGQAWSHTQITALNEQIIEAICSRLPAILHPLVRSTRHFFYFALCGAHSRFGPVSTVRCSTVMTDNGSPIHRMIIEEPPSPTRPKGVSLAKAVRRAVARNWRSLRMIPIPFDQILGDFFRKNRLGGWHFGGTLPMCDSPRTPAECLPSGEVNGLRNVYVIDSAAFPTVPSSTVALLIAANAHRVARNYCETHLKPTN